MMLAAAAAAALHLLPRPYSLAQGSCSQPVALRRRLTVDESFDPAAFDELAERWRALRIPLPVHTKAPPDVRIVFARLPPQGYRLETNANGTVSIAAGDRDGAFYAAMTLAQLARRTTGGWSLPCVRIEDYPALRWRILMDDVSRGPLPTMRYFEERIRTIAAFKMNGYAPMMEHVFVDPRNPLPAPQDGITPAQLSTLDRYARRFHVALIPTQQTLAHMHNTLAVEKYATAADLPHAFYMQPEHPITQAYLRSVITSELQAVPRPPFFHVMSDEAGATPAVFARHMAAMRNLIAPSGARVMFWDDALQQHPELGAMLPHDLVVTSYHYGVEPSYAQYLHNVARAGFDQMVSPAAQNYNQIFPNVATAIANEAGLIADGKREAVLGLFETVWHDDGESLFESTWYPVLYAAADAWERGTIDRARFAADFGPAFFGTSEPGYAADVAKLDDAQQRVARGEYAGTHYYLWADAFDPRIAKRLSAGDLRQVRLESEEVQEHLLAHTPPLHANAARAMYLAARTFDVLGRKYQAAAEVAQYYAQAQALAAAGKPAERYLYWCKYWFWELRDDFEALASLYARQWSYEDRSWHLASNLERFHLEARRDIERADRVNAATFEDYEREHRLPELSAILGAP